ncbi:MAG: glycosyltransferase, partial [Bdellovibrionota bacterium]
MGRKILIVSGLQIFPPESGGQIRTASIAEGLAEAQNCVKIYSFTGRKKEYISRKSSSKEFISHNIFEYICRNPIFGIIQAIFYFLKIPPVWLTLMTSIYIPKELELLLKDADEVLVDFPYLYHVGVNSGRRYILNTHNVESQLYARRGIIGKFSEMLIKRIEHNAMKTAASILFCTDADKNYFQQRCDFIAAKTTVLPNGINLEKIEKSLIAHNKNVVRNKLGIDASTLLILFSGSNYFANTEAFEFIREFCEEQSALLRDLKIKFLIVGTVAEKAINTEFYCSTSKVEDVHHYYSACDAAINPIISGSGSNIKMCEYLAFSLPIFTTFFGARGFNLHEGVSCFYFDYYNLDKVIYDTFKVNASPQFYSIAQ